jgi:hypothetical protein
MELRKLVDEKTISGEEGQIAEEVISSGRPQPK